MQQQYWLDEGNAAMRLVTEGIIPFAKRKGPRQSADEEQRYLDYARGSLQIQVRLVARL